MPALCCGSLILIASCSRPAETAPKAVDITANDKMQFSLTEFDVNPGQKVVVTLKNIGIQPKASMGHDFIVLKQNVNALRFVDANSPYAAKGQLAPGTEKDVVAHTKLLGPGESDTITFTAPYVKGPYEFLCSFPGHYGAGMKGVSFFRRLLKSAFHNHIGPDRK